jgi:signal transduction histidine kinase
MVPDGAASPSSVRERAAAAVRCLALLTVFVMMRLPGSVQRSRALDIWLAVCSLYVLATTLAPLRGPRFKNASLAIVSLDVLLITTLLYITGGMRSEYYLLYYLPILHACMRLNFRDGMGASALAAASYTFVGVHQAQVEIEINPVWRMSAFGSSAIILGCLFSLAAREAAQLRQARDHYRNVSEARSDLMAVMAHEFRNPMTSIAGFSQLLTDNRLSPRQQQEYAAIIHDQCLRLNRLLSGLMELSRLEAGRMEPKFTKVPAHGLLSAAADIFRTSTDGPHIEISSSPHNLEVEADPDMVLQVLHNLIGNAVKYAGDGARVIVRAHHASAEHPGMVHVDVEDDGPGIPASELPKVFDRFYRGRDAKHARTEGSGLGLAICRAIVQAHGGTIWAASERGQGTRFSFTLPAAEPAETAAAEAHVPSDSRQEDLAPAGCR